MDLGIATAIAAGITAFGAAVGAVLVTKVHKSAQIEITRIRQGNVEPLFKTNRPQSLSAFSSTRSIAWLLIGILWILGAAPLVVGILVFMFEKDAGQGFIAVIFGVVALLLAIGVTARMLEKR
jgi:hypothetical protein